MTGNGYIEIEIGGKPIGLRFNMYAIEQFDSVKGNNSYTKNLTTIVYAGLLGDCFAKQSEPAVSFGDVNEWVEAQIFEGDPGGTLNAVADTFLKSNAYIRLTGKGNGLALGETKKKDNPAITSL